MTDGDDREMTRRTDGNPFLDDSTGANADRGTHPTVPIDVGSRPATIPVRRLPSVGAPPTANGTADGYRGHSRESALTRIAFWGIPWYLIMSLAVLTITCAVWFGLQKSFGIPFMRYRMEGGIPVFTFADEMMMTLVTTIVGFLAYPLIFILPSSRWSRRAVGGYGISDIGERMGARSNAGGWIRSAGIGIATGIGIALLSTVISKIGDLISPHPAASDTTTAFTGEIARALASWRGLYIPEDIMVLLCVAVIGPICEEILFRGIIGMSIRDSGLFRRLHGGARTAAVCLSSGLLFGVMHIQPDAGATESILTMIEAGLVGTLFTWMAAYRHRSLGPSIFAHITNNTLSVVAMLAFGVGV